MLINFLIKIKINLFSCHKFFNYKLYMKVDRIRHTLNIFEKIYSTLVRAHLEFATSVWNSLNKREISEDRGGIR